MSNNFVKVQHIETTIKSFHRNVDGDILIKCDPKSNLILSKENAEFDKLYAKLACGKTYNFLCMDTSPDWFSVISLLDYIFCGGEEHVEIMDIVNCKVCTVSGVVVRVDRLEHPELNEYVELIMDPPLKDNRIILEKKYTPDDILGKKYTIDCVKTFGGNFYTLY